jgi:hypothetical protein
MSSSVPCVFKDIFQNIVLEHPLTSGQIFTVHAVEITMSFAVINQIIMNTLELSAGTPNPFQGHEDVCSIWLVILVLSVGSINEMPSNICHPSLCF